MSCAAEIPSGSWSKTAHSWGGRPSLMAAWRNIWARVSKPSSAVTRCSKTSRMPSWSRAASRLGWSMSLQRHMGMPAARRRANQPSMPSRTVCCPVRHTSANASPLRKASRRDSPQSRVQCITRCTASSAGIVMARRTSKSSGGARPPSSLATRSQASRWKGRVSSTTASYRTMDPNCSSGLRTSRWRARPVGRRRSLSSSGDSMSSPVMGLYARISRVRSNQLSSTRGGRSGSSSESGD
mmetsp:Transcript_60108/g.125777  ORF Transcript_60108/g.125777 Transcript_60108/m.125777 type:complete len:240 (-) Transcript_60108:488-1207(-)